jgi:2-hydroxychromene-2-carboxylate isomerase
MTATVHFWFDPTCPFTWATSRWLRETAPAQDAQVEWHLMSLAVLSDGQSVPEQYRSGMARSWRALRVLAAAERKDGSAAVGAVFAALGARLHEQGRELDDEVLAESLEQAGLPADLLAAADDGSYDDDVRASHQQAQERVGTDSGSPVLAMGDGPAWFGPVVAPVPTGQAATDLWHGLEALSRVAAFAELKRGRAPLQD